MTLLFFAVGVVAGIFLVALYIWLDTEKLSDRQHAILERAAEDIEREGET